MSKIQKDAFYYIEESLHTSYEDSRIRVMCTECAEKYKNTMKLMYWKGSVHGYGDYDLECSICKSLIHQR